MNLLHSILPKRLYNQLAVVITVILVATTLTYAFFINKQQTEYAHKTMERNTKAIVDNFTTTAAHMLVVEDFSGLDNFLLEAAKLPNIESIHVVDPKGMPISSVYHPPGFPPYVEYQPVKQDIPRTRMSHTIYTDINQCVLWQPISAGNLLGYVMVKFSLKAISETKRAIWKQTLLLSLVWILLSILLLLLVLKRPISAIKNISHIARQLNTNKGKQFKVNKSCVELEHLGQSINLASEELLHSEQKLSAERERLSVTLQSIGDAVIATDTNGTIVLFNRAAELVTGWGSNRAVGNNIYDVFSELKNDNTITTDLIKLIIENGRITDQVSPFTINQKGDLPANTIMLSGSPITTSQGEITGAVLICKDMTEQINYTEEKNSLEKQLHQAQKMEAIGTLAGGIAHDFNNILTPILGYAQLVEHQLPQESELHKYQLEVINAANRAKELVQQILTFSSSADQELLPLQIQIVVKEAIKLLRATIPTTIEIKQEISPDCGYVLASPTQVHQIVMNLCTNAYHAMRERGGVLTVCLHPLKIDNTEQSDDSILCGEYVLLQITDTGLGMPETIIDRIFDPYFTTKPLGEGTGMGLSVVHGIVTGYNGYLNVQSAEGKGTSFQVYLPKAPDSKINPDPEIIDSISGGSEHILLVDDDPIIVELETKMMRSLGYKITSFTSPEEALISFKEKPQLFDLVFTDMTMPKLTGIQLMQKMHKLRPEIPVVLCTGYSEIIDEESAKNLGIKAYITKPIVLNDLANQLRIVLDNQ